MVGTILWIKLGIRRKRVKRAFPGFYEITTRMCPLLNKVRHGNTFKMLLVFKRKKKRILVGFVFIVSNRKLEGNCERTVKNIQ